MLMCLQMLQTLMTLVKVRPIILEYHCILISKSNPDDGVNCHSVFSVLSSGSSDKEEHSSNDSREGSSLTVRDPCLVL